MQFIFQMSDTLAWPVVALLAIWILRVQIKSLLGRLTEVSVGPASAKMAAQIEDVQSSAAAQEEIAADRAGQRASGATQDEFPAATAASGEVVDYVDRWSADATRQALEEPLRSVIAGWELVRSALWYLFERFDGPTVAPRVRPQTIRPTDLARIKVEPSLIDDQTMGLIRDLQKIRNEAAHDVEPVDKVSAIRYVDAAASVARSIGYRASQRDCGS